MELKAAPWHAPREREIAPGVYVTDIYGSHVLAALLYAAWRRLRGQPAGDTAP